jgi:Gram-negative bacterial TonB protein C-terminal
MRTPREHWRPGAWWTPRRSTGIVLLFVAIGVAQAPAESPPVLDEHVRILHVERMIYPLVAKIGHIEGAVVLRATVDSEGRVSEAVPLSGPKALLEESAKNLKKWTFSSPRSSTILAVYWFRFRGLCELPCPSGFEFYPPNVVVVTTGNPIATE